MAQEQQFLLNGLHCASCVRRVETVIGRLTNVEYVSVNLADQTAFVQGKVTADAVVQAVTKIGFGAE
ncbi:cation transporter, partial [Glaesserella parasuis]